jgi:hypothetical protein
MVMATGWTLEALKEHLESKIELNYAVIQTDLAASKEALSKALATSDKRLESMNEFRGSLADQNRLQMPRAEAEVLIKGLAERLANCELEISQQRAMQAGTVGGKSNIVMIVGLVATVVSIIAVALTLLRR